MKTTDDWKQRETDDLLGTIDRAWGAVIEFRGEQYDALAGRALAALCVASSELAAAQRRVALLSEELMVAVAETDPAYQGRAEYGFAEIINVARTAARVAAESREER